MSREREIFEACLKVPASERSRYLEQVCHGDPALRQRLEKLLRAHEQAEQDSTKINIKPFLEAEDPQQIGQFKIVERLGEGGMGVVYRAVHPRLNRQVALKVIRPSDEDIETHLVRLRREAQALASIRHPNIAVIHDLEEADGLTAIVLELVEGPTLDDLLEKGPLPIPEVISISLQISEALEAAHEKGIVHRDLKPSNIKITPEGSIKVLDFGLAKPVEAVLQLSSTTTDSLTVDGAVVGTPTYMSPEQAKGRAVDQRADIWALGCVVYEMLTGKSPFRGDTPAETLGKVVGTEPDWGQLPSNTPQILRYLLRRALKKDPRQRLQAVGEFRIALQHYQRNPNEVFFPVGESKQESSPRERFVWGLWIFAALLVGIMLGWLIFPEAESALSPEIAAELTTPGAEPLFISQGASAVLSRDGNQVAYAFGRTQNGGVRRIALRSLGEVEARILEGTESGYNPFFSPDGRWVGFVTPRELKKVSIQGGQPLVLATVNRSRGASWGPDGSIVISSQRYGGLETVSEQGGELRPLTRLEEGEWSHRWPQHLPGGRRLIFTSLSSPDVRSGRIEVLDIATGERRVVQTGATFGRYSKSGYLLYWREGAIFAAPFDLKRGEVVGPPHPVVHTVTGNAEGGAQFDVADNGTLVHVRGSAAGHLESQLTWVNPDGSVYPASSLKGSFAFGLQLSPDEKRVATSLNDRGNVDIWVLDLEQDIPTRLTFHEATDGDPVWAPDGQSLYFASNRDVVTHIYQVPIDGSSGPRLIRESPYNKYPDSVSPDGRYLIYRESHPDTETNLWILPLDGSSEAEPYLATPFREVGSRFSPDGKWVAFISYESGEGEVYIRSFPLGSGKWRVSQGGGASPRWSRDGRQLFFREGNQAFRANIEMAETGLRVQRPEAVTTVSGGFGGGLFDVAEDGSRFLTVQATGSDAEAQLISSINLTLNWFTALNRAMRDEP